jgi:hypothetical protein
MKIIILSIFCIVQFQYLLCQNITIQGIAKDKETHEPLSYASICLKNFRIGTVCNEKGVFVFQIPDRFMNDTIIVSYIGYKKGEIALSSAMLFLDVELIPVHTVINEIVVHPLSPEAYLKIAINKINLNYSFKPFQTISYYREKFTENNNVIDKKEAIFKSYYSISDEVQHELVLFRKPDSLKRLLFMKTQEEKEKQKALKKGETVRDEENDNYSGMSYGGPESILKLDLIKQRPSFLDSNYFKEYTYTFDKKKALLDKNLMFIHFKSKGKIDKKDISVKEDGLIILDINTFAIVSIEFNGKYVIPLGYRPILLIFGIIISEPNYKQVVKYEKYDDMWYPKYFSYISSTKLTKTYMFKPNEHSHQVTEQLFIVNEIRTTHVLPIPKENIFNPWKKIEAQVHNEENLNWSNMNRIGE